MTQFNFLYDPNVSLEQRIGFEMAAAIWSSFLLDDVTINLRIGATDSLDNNQAVGGAIPIFHEQNYGVYQAYLEQDATSAEDAEANASLQTGNTVDVLIGGTVIDGNTNIMLTSAQAKALGMTDALQLDNGTTWDRDLVDPTALDGYIVVNNSYAWNYDFAQEAEAPENTLDFLTMALHEIGHSLGFVSGLDGLLETFQLHSGETQAEGFTALDMFRHTIDSQEIENPDGSVADLTLGANAHFSLDGATALATFSTGQDTTAGGDGYQASHWERFQQALGIMDPTLGYQERTEITHLDLQAFDALGWDINYAALEQGLDFQALYAQVLQTVANDFGIGVAAIETAVANGQDWYSLGNSSAWQVFKDQMLELGYGDWWQEFEAVMLDLGWGSWWQAFDQQILELGWGSWWQLFEDQVLELGWGSWWQEFETDMLELGWGSWWQQFEPQMLELGWGGWWQVFEQQMVALGWGGWWQEFEAAMLDLGWGSWWQAFEADVLELGWGSWWQLFEDQVLELGWGSWWQEFESSMLELGWGTWWQAFELGDNTWWQQVETHVAHLADVEAAASQTPENDVTITGGNTDDILNGGSGRDLISGDAGDDLLDGKEGDDILLGDRGNDIVYGWDGDDALYGGKGDDLLAGENGNDRIYGEHGHDILAGGRGHDILEGGTGRDVLKGDTGNDVLDGGKNNDDLAGGSGDDILIGGGGQDALSGGAGEDQLYGDAYSLRVDSNTENTTDTSATTSSTDAPPSSSNDANDAPPPPSSDELLSDLGVTTASNLLNFWVRLEAEDMRLTNYNADEQGDASEGQVISTSSEFLSSIFGNKARTDFSGPTGAYQLIVGYYDDTADASELTLRIKREADNNGNNSNNGWGSWGSWGSWKKEVREEHSWLLDQGVGSASSSNNFFTYVIDGVSLESGDELELIGDGEGDEQVRIDYIDIVAVNDASTIASDGSDKLLGAAFYNGNFYAVASSAATAAAEATNRGGSLISVDSGTQLETWLQNTFGSTANIIEIHGEVEAANLVTDSFSIQEGLQRLEAEAVTFSDGFSVVSETDYNISASGDSLLIATSTTTPSIAHFTVQTSGVYNIYANYFDSDGGVAEATVFVNGTALHSWQFNLDDNQLHTRVLGLDVILEAGDVLELHALADEGDHAAIDYFSYATVASQDLSIPTDEETGLPSLRFEAEDMDLSASQHSQDRYESAASGNNVVYTSNKNDGLTATTSFTGSTGIYDIVVGYFDDDGGSASYRATLAGNLLDSWQADLDLEDSNTGSKNLVTRTVARGVAVNTGDNITLQSIREGNDYAYLDYVEFIAHDPTAPIRVEAEYMTLSGAADLYTVTAASTGRAIRSTSSSSSNTVEGVTTFTGATGVYDIVMGYFDENDGEAQLTLSQGATQLDSWIAAQDLGSSSINATTFTTRTISGVTLHTGDEISFTSLKQSYDWGTVDYIEFQPFVPAASSNSGSSSTSESSSASSSSSTPNAGATFQLEVETMDLSADADIVGASFASSSQFVQVQPPTVTYVSSGDDDDDDAGGYMTTYDPQEFKSTGLFTGESGYYDVVIGYYDENDGSAEISIKIDSREVDRWFADQNRGTSSVNATSFTTRTVASGLYINQTDLIELTVIKNGLELGAIDYIQFIAVDDPTTTAAPPVTTDALEENGDVLRGGLGNDHLDGGLGNDILYGEDEFDIGQAGGNDTLYGAEGDDMLYGNSGDDTLYGDFTAAKGTTVTIFESSFEGVSSTGIVAAPLDGWSSSDAHLEVWTSQSADGTNHLELNVDPVNYYQDTHQIFREIQTVAGEHYTLTFQYSPRNGYDASVNAMEVRLGGETLLAIAEDGTNNSGLSWKTYTISFDGDGSAKTLEFVSTGQAVNYGRGAHLDDIKLVAASEAVELGAPSELNTETLIFQQGLNGYTGTVDTMLSGYYLYSSYGNAASINIDGDDWGYPIQGLVRFDDIFGSQTGQIALDATINSAVLELEVFDPGSSLVVYDMLQNWSNTTTWYSFKNGIQVGAETASISTASTSAISSGTLQIDVTASLQAWQQDPTSNKGWAFLPTGTDGVDFYSAEGSIAPRLVVDVNQGTASADTSAISESISSNDTLYGGSGNDNLFGDIGDDILNGTDADTAGVFELDALTGGVGVDQFILGDSNQAYYSTGGDLDYVVITDFTAGIDTVQLHGSATDYQQSQQGSDVFLSYGVNQDLVAKFEAISYLDLNTSVTFV